MELFVRSVPYGADEHQVTRCLEPILHGEKFRDLFVGGAPYNFMVRLFKSKKHHHQNHSGNGALLLPSEGIGQRLLALSSSTCPVEIHGRRLKFEPSRKPAFSQGDILKLREPYQDPEIRQERERTRADLLRAGIHASSVAFGWPCQDGSISLEHESPESTTWDVLFNLDDRCIILKSSKEIRILLHLRAIQSTALDSEGAVLWLERPPLFEKQPEVDMDAIGELFASLLDLEPRPPMRYRLSSPGGDPSRIIPYLRVLYIRFDDSISSQEFERRAKKMGVSTYSSDHDLERRGLFMPGIIERYQAARARLPFKVAFQVQGLLSRCAFNPQEILEILRDIHAALTELGRSATAECVKALEQEREGNPEATPAALFADVVQSFRTSNNVKAMSDEEPGVFECHRATITPSSIILTGPLPDETNRVIRKYRKYAHKFIRIDFTEEDGLHLRKEKNVDLGAILDDRIGEFMKNGLLVAGRRFEFLAYSSSALKEHAVWFMTPFTTSDGQYVTSESIRRSLGDFSKVIYCPSRYGARLSQAFSSTEPSITIKVNEIRFIPDKESDQGSLYTDGVGTMSPQVAEEIWAKYTEPRSKRSRRRLKTPSAFQIRLGGLKGMLCVDSRLQGRVVCVRDSMNKFHSNDREVEIARAFDRPMTMFLNRPLIMLLETLKVPLEPFMALQTKAVEETRDAMKSFDTAARLLEQYGLGTAFRLTSVFLQLHKLDVALALKDQSQGLLPFLGRMLQFVENHILRDLKYKARIPVPNAWTLVGVSDEYDYLGENEIYARVRTIDGEEQYLEGPVMISRSPTVHPGDARMVWAIGKPSRGAPPGLEDLTNCVVFPCKGHPSLPQCLAGGDLDGDLYCLVLDPQLHFRWQFQHGDYDPPQLVTLDRPSTIKDVAQFVINYIKNDLLGVISTRSMLIADIREDCLADEDCVKLAKLHSIAVDYPKTGRHVEFEQMPSLESNRRPDWHANELNDNDPELYQSNRHIGHLFRAIELPALPEARKLAHRQRRRIQRDEGEALNTTDVLQALSHDKSVVSRHLRPKINTYVDIEEFVEGQPTNVVNELLDIFDRYWLELQYIAKTNSLSNATALSEEEVVAGSIVAKCSQPRRRQDVIADMRRSSTSLCDQVRNSIEGTEDTSEEDKLLRAWVAWKISEKYHQAYAAMSFGILALDTAFNAMRKLDGSD
ncbi:Probable RNA-dependent RNA polymerase SHL2; AltName: Full=Protein SHOOTLESS 2 [Serendipita indica DSM 11827]|nr:Probable RNA-dependent RNA polymerase SHL2; AltName: Full=Protein SHOOTLESS 2 [Serendipita indica DSM 11827]